MRIWQGSSEGGRLVERASVSALDHGFTVADGVFETLKVVPAGPVALNRHLRRLVDSARVLHLPVPNERVVRSAVSEVVAAWTSDGGELGRLRITFTAGEAPLGSERGDASPTLVVAVSDTDPWPPTTSAITVPWTRNERSAVAGAKTTSYAENVVALRAARERGASEALVANTVGELCEGTGTNVFVVVDGEVFTPPLASGCLPGITRELVIEWFGAREQTMPIEVLTTADEVFLTSSTRDVHPVVRLDDREWSTPGPVSRELQEAFTRLMAGDIDP
jgi:branched-chain amino acid aminotransferase